MWWDALEFQRYDSAFYEALCAKGREQGSTTNGDNDGFPFGHPSEDQAGDAVNEGDGGEERVKFPEGVFVENPNGLYEDEARADRDANDDNGDEQGRRDGEEQEEHKG
ncbi:MAG: hypothetical protein M1838_001810 [Thelocarpon superellum]|nr:MAG: hypothetical protein M1838_001810 [Thelocarpon superellum]